MPNNFKALGVALVATLAMAATLASGAEAFKVTTGATPAILTGEVIEHSTIGKTETFKLAGGQDISCEEVKSTATVRNGDTSITIIPTYNKCHATIGPETFKATVTMNDCDYFLHGGKEVTSTTFSEGQVDLVCPEGKVMEIHLYKSPTVETEELCTYKISPYVNKVSNEFHNITGSFNDVTITTTAKEIAITRTGSLLCGSASSTATYTGSTTMAAFEDAGGTISEGTVKNLTEGQLVGLTISN